jgi:hypothetical protein
MGLDRKLDPVTKDWIDDGAGEFEQTTSLITAAQHQVLTPKGKWWGDNEAGCDLHGLLPLRDETGLRERREAVRAALSVFEEDGRGRNLMASVTVDYSGRVLFQGEMEDLGANADRNLTPLLEPFGA